MFETAGWVSVGDAVGPVPACPPVAWSTAELIAWAGRAPYNGDWLSALQSIDSVGLNEADRLRLARAWDRFRQGAEAEYLGQLGLIARQACPADPDNRACLGGRHCTHDWSRDEVAAAMHLAPQTSSGLLVDSRELVGRSAALLEAVADGRVPAYGARWVARRLAVLDDATAALVLDRVMSAVGTMTPGKLDRLAQLTIEGLRNPAEALAAHQRARRARTGIGHPVPLEDGMASALITATEAEIAELRAWAEQFAVSNRPAGDERTVGQRRVDALLTALIGPILDPAPTGPECAEPAPASAAEAGATAGAAADDSTPAPDRPVPDAPAPDRPAPDVPDVPAPDRPVPDVPAPDRPAPDSPARNSRRINLRLIMSADTLLGRDDDPGWLTGVGAIPAYLARQLAVAPAALQRALSDHATGQLLNLGREHRFALTDLDRYVRARDVNCTGLGCTRSSESADLDHVEPWAAGGRTDASNLQPLCRPHHRARDAGWTPRRNPDGTVTWVSPAGLTYQTLKPDEGRNQRDDPLDEGPPAADVRQQPDRDELRPDPPPPQQPGPVPSPDLPPVTGSASSPALPEDPPF